jgi:hypothetical protein
MIVASVAAFGAISQACHTARTVDATREAISAHAQLQGSVLLYHALVDAIKACEEETGLAVDNKATLIQTAIDTVRTGDVRQATLLQAQLSQALGSDCLAPRLEDYSLFWNDLLIEPYTDYWITAPGR